MSESFYSTSEVARLFEINRVTIYRWVQEGVVKAYKVGKHLKIPVSEVERLWREFGFPDAPYRHFPDTAKKNQSRYSGNNGVKHEKQKRLVMAAGSDEDDLKVIREIFAETKLEEECTLVIYMDTLEAALAIGKEKPDLLLIKIMKPDGSDVEFARKIISSHSDIRIIFLGASSGDQNKNEGAVFPENISTTFGRAKLHQEIVKALGLDVRGRKDYTCK